MQTRFYPLLIAIIKILIWLLKFFNFFFPQVVNSYICSLNSNVLNYFFMLFPLEMKKKPKPKPVMLPSFYLIQHFLDKTFLTKKVTKISGVLPVK